MNQEFKMVIANVYSLREGPTVSGRIEQGSVRVGNWLVIVGAHGRIPVRVVLVQQFRKVVDVAEAGPEPVGISVSGVDVDLIRNRDLLVTEDGSFVSANGAA